MLFRSSDGYHYAWLQSVSCPSPDACAAVGYEQDGPGGVMPVAEEWNGSAWATLTVSLPSGAMDGSLGSVSCPAATTCTATGYVYPTAPFITRWNGHVWTSQSAPSGDFPEAVSCPTAHSCTAAGYMTDVGAAPAIESWSSATGWTAQAPPVPPEAEHSKLLSISCLAPATCTSVGYYDPEEFKQTGHLFAEHE